MGFILTMLNVKSKDPFPIRTANFMIPCYGIFPETGNHPQRSLWIFSVASGTISGENNARTSSDYGPRQEWIMTSRLG